LFFTSAQIQHSLKESIYKAMHPILCGYVGLQEAEVDPLSDGNATVRLNFLHERPESVSPRAHSMVVRSASWRKVNGFFLTSASVGLAQET
jgi:4'-phosphopantetheinyl transferase EntD